MILFTSVTFACDNFSGSYVTSDLAEYSIDQKDCASMNMTDASGTKTITFNSVEQIIYDLELEEGRLQVFITSKLNGNQWVYSEKAVMTFTDGRVETDKSWSEVFLNTTRDLVTVKHKSDGSTDTYIDKRE